MRSGARWEGRGWGGEAVESNYFDVFTLLDEGKEENGGGGGRGNRREYMVIQR